MRGALLVAVLVGCSFNHGVLQGVFQDAPSGSAGSDSGTGDAPTTLIDAAPDAKVPPPSGITCPGSMCGSVCCEGCVDILLSICTGRVFECDGPEDCGSGEVCCNDKNGSVCTMGSCNGNGHFEACHVTSDCSFSCNDCSFRSDYGQKVCCE